MSAPEIPTKHKAAVYDEPGKISTKIVELDTPEPGPGEVLIRLTHSGVCHSDLGVMTNSWRSLPHPTEAGQVGGHEGVGEVVKFGPGADDGTLKLGQRVGIKWVSKACGNCLPCLAGSDGVCFNGKVSGYYTPGTFQQYCLGPANYVTPIPDALSSADAAPFLCAGVTTYAALRKSGAKSGQWVVISGAGGGLGHLACQLASRGFGLRVIGIDDPKKEQLARDSGVEHFFSPFSDTLTEDVQKVTDGLGASAVIVCTAANAAYAQALDLLRFGGTLVCVGMPEGDLVPIAKAYPSVMVGKEWNITAVAVGNRADAREVLEFAARGIVKTHYKLEKLDRLTQVFEDMHEGKLMGRVVVELE